MYVPCMLRMCLHHNGNQMLFLSKFGKVVALAQRQTSAAYISVPYMSTSVSVLL